MSEIDRVVDYLKEHPLPARQVEAELARHNIPHGYILGEEADIGQCEFCGKTGYIDAGIVCEGCSGYFEHRRCLRQHKCDRLFDRDGKLVHVGDQLKYPENVNIFTVVEILPSFVRVAACMAERRRDKERLPIIPRLMEHV